MTILSVLDQSPIPDGSTGGQALAETLTLATAAEALGYHRYWLAEHHNTASLAGTAPEVLAACVAARTNTIRVGAGGVLLPYYRPLKVAECFRVLHALFPDRIDLGIGRADGGDGAAVAALAPGPPAHLATLGDSPSWSPLEPLAPLAPLRGEADDPYPDQVAELVSLLSGRTTSEHLTGGARAMPEGPGAPELWVLASSSYGASLAAALGLPLCFAHFISPTFGAQVTAAYHRDFQPSERTPEPRASLAVSVICADSDAEAERLVLSQDVWALSPEGAERGPLLSPDQARSYPLTEMERLLLDQGRPRRMAGAPDRVKALLLNLTEEYHVDELVVRTICHDPAARLRSYQLLADAFGIEPRG